MSLHFAITRLPTAHPRWLGLGLALSLFGSAGARADDLSSMAKRLADLRGEVEGLSDQLAAQKSDQQEQVRSLARQKAELELEVQREDTRAQKLRQAVATQKAATAAQESASASLGPTFQAQLAAARAYVSESMPFRRKERSAELDKIEEQVKSGILAPQRALNRLWGFIEDELRMTRESGMFSQPVMVDGKEQLADVIRLGMVAMYYRTADEAYGVSSFEGGQWSFKSIDGDAQKKQVRTLFETFKKQIRVGYFELPPVAMPQAAR
jgi:Protein of unknown function (DUF3450)